MKDNFGLLREYVRKILQESVTSPDVSSLGALIQNSGSEKQVVIFKYDLIYAALSRKKEEEDTFNFLVDNIKKSIVGYGIFGPPDEGNAYGAWEVTHAAAPNLGKILYGIGYAISPSGLLMSDRHQVSFEADAAWKKASKERNHFKLDNLPPNNKTKSTEDDAELHDTPGKEHLDYAYESQGWEKSITARLVAQGKTALIELSDAVNRDKSAISNAFFAMGTHFFGEQYKNMVERRKKKEKESSS